MEHCIPIVPASESVHVTDVVQATFYGTPTSNSLHLIRYYFGKYPEDAEKVVLSVKGAYKHGVGPDGSPEEIRESVKEALNVLDGTKTIDVFELGR
jgi:pyridoxine 4-dehydrogenase